MGMRAIRSNLRRRSLQAVGSTAKKCHFHASRGLENQCAAGFAFSDAQFKGGASFRQFPVIRKMTADGRTHDRV
jgi:hypothetical protein